MPIISRVVEYRNVAIWNGLAWGHFSRKKKVDRTSQDLSFIRPLESTDIEKGMQTASPLHSQVELYVMEEERK